jgi:ribose 5-phosphate isomerase B
MKIYLGADHGGYKLKEKIKTWLTEWGFEYEDLGAHTLVEGDDYPDFAFSVGQKVVTEPGSLGILACRSGQGECVAANKVKGVRAAIAWSVESARAGRNDDDINVICLAADHVGLAEQRKIISAFIGTPFGTEERYQRRIDKIHKFESGNQ